MAISYTLLTPEKVINLSSDTCAICKDTNCSRSHRNSAHHSETCVLYNSRLPLDDEDNDCDDDDDDGEGG